jgi:hypothetical protein
MAAEQKGTPPEETIWNIALDWFRLNGRSAAVLVKDYLCPDCARRLSTQKEPALKTLFAGIENCCSQNPDFIHEKLPIMESVFRLFLRHGNQPMTLQEVSSELGQVRYGDFYRTAPETLARILKNDHFYGLQEISE